MGEKNFFDFMEEMNRRKRSKPAPAASGAGGAAKETDALTVSQLTAQIDKTLKSGLPASILVRGEVSNWHPYGTSGHIYFTLKDSGSCIDCVMFRNDAARLKFAAKDGMELLATGRVAVYAARGRYQFYATSLQPLGQGALELAFQQLRAKLDAEGLFKPERKKPLPEYPMRLALVTSTQTAALQDMLKVLRRYPFLHLMVYHVPVQGDGAAARIADAIDHLNQCAGKLGGIDVILLGRGGGSLEDLWQFNEEAVARAVAASGIPIITGIGHEVDISIADLVADYHAHTPTEAAQIAVSHWRTARDVLDQQGIALRRTLRQMVQDCRNRLTAIERHEVFRRPMDRVNLLRQRLDDRERALSLALANRLRALRRRLDAAAIRLDQHRPGAILARLRQRLFEQEQRLGIAVSSRLRQLRDRLFAAAQQMRERHPRHRVNLARQELASLDGRLSRAAAADLARRALELRNLEIHLNAVSPANVLKRGYSITLVKKTGQVLRSASQMKEHERIITRLADGDIESEVIDSKQMRLFE